MTKLSTQGRRTFQAEYQEYANSDTIRRYRRTSAGEGINFLLDAVYGPMFLEQALAAQEEAKGQPLQILEFGCGAGMALQHVTDRLGEVGIQVELAIGTDLVDAMIATAQSDLDECGTPWARERIRYIVTPNEELVERIAEDLGRSAGSLAGSFHLALGVNTFRYALRRGSAGQVVEQLHYLLASGGRVVMIDMNDRFPYGLKPKLRAPAGGGSRRFFGTEQLPSLEAYAQPFVTHGFEILERGYFCWIPHSASHVRFRVARAISPLLDKMVPDRAMRSLVIARKS